MLQSGWLWFILLTLGPLLGALLVERARLGPTVSIAAMLVLLGGAGAVILHLGRPVAMTNTAAIAPRALETRSASAQGAVASTAEASAEPAARQTELERWRREASGLREQLASLDSRHAAALAAKAKADNELETERSAHLAAAAEVKAMRARIEGLEAERATAAKTTGTASVVEEAQAKVRAAQDAVDEQAAKLEAARQRMAGDLARLETAQQADRAEIADLRARLAAARATGTVSAPANQAPPVQGGPIAPPAPFSHAVARDNGAAAIATASSAPADTAAIRGAMASGLTKPGFTLSALTQTEVVKGQPGHYYRIACRGGATTKRLEFEPGGYNITGGDGAVQACARSIQTGVLAGLPKSVARTLYAQGFASTQGFARPVALAAGDDQLKSVPYLPHSADKQHYEAKAKLQTVASAFGNKELPVLRAAYVADLIEQATSGAVKPMVLEGEIKPNGDAASRSFDLVLYVNW